MVSWLVRESGKRRGYPVRGLGVYVLVSELRDEGRRPVRDERGGSVPCVCRSGDPAFGDGQLKRIPECFALHPPTRCGSRLSREGGLTDTRSCSESLRPNGWILAGLVSTGLTLQSAIQPGLICTGRSVIRRQPIYKKDTAMTDIALSRQGTSPWGTGHVDVPAALINAVWEPGQCQI